MKCSYSIYGELKEHPMTSEIFVETKVVKTGSQPETYDCRALLTATGEQGIASKWIK